MAHAVSVRLDDEAAHALRVLEAGGLSRSEAIRTALIQSAERVRTRAALAAEVAALESDEDDLAELAAVSELMDALRAPG